MRIDLSGKRRSAVLGRRICSWSVALAALTAGWLSASEVRGAEACWSPAEIRHKPGEERIAQNTLRALMPAPDIPLGQMTKSPYSWRGVLRRVDLPPDRKLVALTFDLCEQPHEVSGYQGDLVDFLRDHEVKATFFAGGKWMLTHEQRTQQLMADPLFEIANHAWEHRNLRLLSGSKLHDEIWNAQLAHRKVHSGLSQKQCLGRTGPEPAHKRAPERMTLFRFPFGACHASSLKAVEDAGLRAIQWDVSSADPWPGQLADKMVRDVVSRVRPGSIVLFHANGRGWHTGKALPEIVRQLRAQGYEFVTVTGLLGTPGARPVTVETCYDAKPGDADRYDALAAKLADRHARAIAKMKEAAASSAHLGREPAKEKPAVPPQPRGSSGDKAPASGSSAK